MATTLDSTLGRNTYIIISFLGILILGAGWVLWSNAYQLFSDPFTTFTNLDALLLFGFPLTASYVAVVSLIVVVSLIMNPWWARTILYACVAIPLIATPTPISLTIIASLLISLALILFDVIVRKDIKIHITQPLFHIFGKHVMLLSTLISILFSGYIFVSTTETIDETQLEIPQSFMTDAFTLGSPIIQSQIDGYVETLQEQTIAELEKQIPTLVLVPYEDKLLLTEGIVSPLVNEAMKDFGLTETQIQSVVMQISQTIGNSTTDSSSGQQTIMDAKNDLENQLLDSVSKQVNSLVNEYKGLAPYAVALTSFSVFTALGYVVNIFAIGSAWIVIFVLKKGGLVEEHTFNVEAKRYVIKKHSS